MGGGPALGRHRRDRRDQGDHRRRQQPGQFHQFQRPLGRSGANRRQDRQPADVKRRGIAGRQAGIGQAADHVLVDVAGQRDGAGGCRVFGKAKGLGVGRSPPTPPPTRRGGSNR